MLRPEWGSESRRALLQWSPRWPIRFWARCSIEHWSAWNCVKLWNKNSNLKVWTLNFGALFNQILWKFDVKQRWNRDVIQFKMTLSYRNGNLTRRSSQGACTSATELLTLILLSFIVLARSRSGEKANQGRFSFSSGSGSYEKYLGFWLNLVLLQEWAWPCLHLASVLDSKNRNFSDLFISLFVNNSWYPGVVNKPWNLNVVNNS